MEQTSERKKWLFENEKRQNKKLSFLFNKETYMPSGFKFKLSCLDPNGEAVEADVIKVNKNKFTCEHPVTNKNFETDNPFAFEIDRFVEAYSNYVGNFCETHVSDAITRLEKDLEANPLYFEKVIKSFEDIFLFHHFPNVYVLPKDFNFNIIGYHNETLGEYKVEAVYDNVFICATNYEGKTFNTFHMHPDSRLPFEAMHFIKAYFAYLKNKRKQLNDSRSI